MYTNCDKKAQKRGMFFIGVLSRVSHLGCQKHEKSEKKYQNYNQTWKEYVNHRTREKKIKPVNKCA